MRKLDRCYWSGFLAPPPDQAHCDLEHQTDWISVVRSSSSFSTVLFPPVGVCLGGEERRKQPTTERHGSGRSPHVATPCTRKRGGERIRRKGCSDPLLLFRAHLQLLLDWRGNSAAAPSFLRMQGRKWGLLETT
jgi:hypothetical protein